MTNPFYNKTGNPQSQSRGLSSQIRNEFALIEQGFDECAPISSPAFTGNPTAPTPNAGTSNTTIATTAFVMAAALDANIPGQTGNAGKFLGTDGTNASWQNVPSGYSARTSNTALGASDRAKFIDITSGSFTQTFAAAATLGDGWWCYVRNSGSGDITLNPNASELIDDRASYIMYPNETRLIQCDGTAFYSVVLTSFKRTFTASATVTIPPGYSRMGFLLWGAGGGGSSTGQYGGGGGACTSMDFDPASITTASLVVGAGGAAGSPATAGGYSQFGTFVAGGGLGGGGGIGYGGCAHSWQNGGTLGGWPEVYQSAYNYVAPLYAAYGGGMGRLNASDTYYELNKSVWGGGGGIGTGGPVGTSVYGGNGGVGAGAGTIPGGGGGSSGGGGGAGARGELRLWGIL